MTTTNKYNNYGEELEYKLRLRTAPIGLKMLEKEEDIPEGAFRPKRDKGIHLAQCQAFAMSRRDGVTVAMLKEDNWCFAPLITYGLVDKPDDPKLERLLRFPCLERERYVGIVSAPLKSANFEPDIVLIYCDPAQLRSILTPTHFMGDELSVNSHFYPPSCSYLVVPVLSKGQSMVALPDVGEDDRTIAGKDEIILSVPIGEIEKIISGFNSRFFQAGRGDSAMLMMANFPRPEFYKELFKKWELDLED